MAKDPPVFFSPSVLGSNNSPSNDDDDDDDEDEIQSTQKDGIMLGLSCEKCESNSHLMQ